MGQVQSVSSIRIPLSVKRKSKSLTGIRTGKAYESGSMSTSNLLANSSHSEFVSQRVIKLLLFGPGEVGKTTIMRKLMLVHGNDLMKQRRENKPYICYNVVEGAAMTLMAARRLFDMTFTEEKEIENEELILTAYRAFQAQSHHCNLNDAQDIVDAILYFVNESHTFKGALQRRAEYALFDTWFYFVNKLNDYPTWGGKDWIPSEDDLLRSRVRTTGGTNFTFSLDGQRYQINDVGGQRAERAKFFFMFNQMDCLVFVASLSEYDEALFEDSKQNRLRETIRVWRETIKNSDFTDKCVILLLNKFDLFKKKYMDDGIPIVPTFRYRVTPPTVDQEEGDEGCPLAIKWFKDLYMNQVPSEKVNDVKVFVTSALDGLSLTKVMNLTVSYLQRKLVPGKSKRN